MKKRKNIIVRGIVQGVGFRPFIHKLVSAYRLFGWVLNSDQGVEIDIEGEEIELNQFIADIKGKLPPLARIEEMEVSQLPLAGYKNFSIKKSITSESNHFVLVSPDMSICEDCMNELFDPFNRRFRYPFINCTNCGPRFTIIKDIPYDREKTSMDIFKMCPKCLTEYTDIEDRRYHAQPNACEKCGPEVSIYQNNRRLKTDNPIMEAVRKLKEGEIGAIKGLGGYHLACDATNDHAVRRLRRLKNREAKPFAIMACEMDKIKQFCYVNPEEEKVLSSRARPIVLLKKKLSSDGISESVAPKNNYLGVMLPYTPLHYLLLKDQFFALVMTSGNISEEPIISDNKEAFEKLDKVVDFFLTYNRDIYNRCDDSVIKFINHEPIFFRRSRGYVPQPVTLDFKIKEVMALGGELKNTISFSKGNYIFPSQYLGDLKSLSTLDFLKQSIKKLEKIFRVNPGIIACDLHPDYLSTRYAEEIAKEKNMKMIRIQHHHAHIASCMAENGISEAVIGIAYDGTGYGDDHAVWGGELLIANFKNYFRAGHLKYCALPGGDRAINEPWRMAYSYLYSIYGREAKDLNIDFIKRRDPNVISIIDKMIEKKINSPWTSSCGRLFDAISSLIGIRDVVSYEGQAAMELESICHPDIDESYGYDIIGKEKKLIIEPKKIITELISDLSKGISKKVIASKFHNTVAEFTLKSCIRIREQTKINKVVISGGVFQNKYLTEKVISLLTSYDFLVFSHKKVPPNDGGLSLGQAVIAGITDE